MKVLMIDNYDSFTYNLVHYLNELDCEVVVWRNDKFKMSDAASFDKIILSPGPGIPDEAGQLKPLIREYADKKPILGVCLGLQAIGEVFGGTLINLDTVHHGVDSLIKITVKDESLFKGLPDEITVGRYHSWVVAQPLPPALEVTSLDQDGYVMSLRHKVLDVKGVQFHPESILTPLGKDILKNWITN